MEKTDRKNEFFEELKRTRESKGLRLEDIARRYRIRFSFLEAIESGSFDDLPEPVYAKTFIKTYAGALGVDAGPILAQYAKHIEKTLPSAPPEEAAAAKGPDAGKAVLAWFGMLGSRVIWTFLALAVLIGLGIYAFQDRPERPVPAKTAVREEARPPEKPAEVKPPEGQPAQPAQQPESAPPQQPDAAPAPKKPESQPAAEKKEPATAPPPAAGGTLSLTIEATEAAWVQVRADRTPAVQRLLQAGEKVSAEAREKITVDLGNAGGVQITFQGQSLGSPGKRGEVVHLVYPEGKRVEKKRPEEPKPPAGAEAKPAAE
ncbi:MAG: Helix-turn-helix domain protein [Syntrophaceae bacterium PtaB.Bin038]|nr:MAG: Helix-turn-helix domain protein [Syntrophaceae bacterium PtaB.Bin038]